MKKILFVCLGNICRSPAAEAVMNKLIKEEGLSEKLFCDSAGTEAYHEGELADQRMRAHAKKRGIDITSIARRITPQDLDVFDYIVTMDQSNYNNVKELIQNKKIGGKLVRMCDFCTKFHTNEVPDPYYGGEKGFEHVIDILEDACQGLLSKIKGEL